MQERQRRADLVSDSAHVLPRKGRELSQVAAVQELHRVVRLLTFHAVVERVHDTRMRELDERVELSLEELDRSSGLFSIRLDGEHLERDDGSECLVPRPVNGGHAAATQQLPRFVSPSDSERKDALALLCHASVCH